MKNGQPTANMNPNFLKRKYKVVNGKLTVQYPTKSLEQAVKEYKKLPTLELGIGMPNLSTFLAAVDEKNKKSGKPTYFCALHGYVTYLSSPAQEGKDVAKEAKDTALKCLFDQYKAADDKQKANIVLAFARQVRSALQSNTIVPVSLSPDEFINACTELGVGSNSLAQQTFAM